MVASRFFITGLRVRRSANSPPHSSSVSLQQSAQFEVLDQARDRFVNLRDIDRVIFFKMRVLVPLFVAAVWSRVTNLDEPHAAFGESARQQARQAEVFGRCIIQTV